MDAYETGYAFGQLMAALACLLVPLAVVGAVIWFVLARSSRKRRSLPPQVPYGAPASHPYPGGPASYTGHPYPGPNGPPSYQVPQQPHPAPHQPYPAQPYPPHQPYPPAQQPPAGSGH